MNIGSRHKRPGRDGEVVLDSGPVLTEHAQSGALLVARRSDHAVGDLELERQGQRNPARGRYITIRQNFIHLPIIEYLPSILKDVLSLRHGRDPLDKKRRGHVEWKVSDHADVGDTVVPGTDVGVGQDLYIKLQITDDD